MSKNKFEITGEELAQGLNISIDRLYEIVDFFDSDAKDDWELKENVHFIWLVKNKTRMFSQLGGFAIAKYIDATQSQGVWARLKEFLFHYKAKLLKAYIRKQVLNHCSSLVVRNGRSYLSKQDSIGILMTSHARVNKAFEDLQSSNTPLEKGLEFDDFEDVRFYSVRGFEKVAHLLSEELTQQDRRAWCKEIEITGSQVLKQLVDAETAFYNKIVAAKKIARKRDGNRCQATGKISTHGLPLTMDVHHIFSQQHYPDLAASQDNLVTLHELVHKNFHAWSGKEVACTPDRLIDFLSVHHPDADKLIMRLHYIKKVYRGV